MKPATLFAVLLAAAAGWLACSPADGAAAQATHGGDHGASDAGLITVRYWVAGCSVAEDLWKYRKSSTITCDARGRTLASAHGVMRWPDYLAASDIDTVIVEGEGLDGLRFELEWSGDDTFDSGRSIEATAGASAVSFALGDAPEWRGTIRRFRLTWRGEPSPGSRIVAAWGRRHRS